MMVISTTTLGSWTSREFVLGSAGQNMKRKPSQAYGHTMFVLFEGTACPTTLTGTLEFTGDMLASPVNAVVTKVVLVAFAT